MHGAALYRYGVVLVAWWPAIVLGVACIAAWSVAPIREAAARIPRARWIALGALLAFALRGAWRLLWFSDDALISLHYARNWIEGHGLVFNPGEHVEGYTNFLWLALVAACGRLGLDMPTAAIALNLIAYAATILTVHRVVRALVTDHEVIVSFAAVMTALSYPMISFATGGLETVFGALLVVSAALAAHQGRTLAAGSYGILATMTHPDHALFYVAIAAVLLANLVVARARSPGPPAWWRRPGVRALARYAAPFFLVYVPYFALRWRYYGDPLPNTFYAKSAAHAYYTQGLVYLFVSALVAGAFGVLPAFAIGAVRLRRTVFGQIVVVALPLYLAYVARIGGDYMTGRLLVPVLPLVFAVAELGVRSLRGRPAVAALLAAPFVLACLPTPVHKREAERWYLTDERTYWTVETLRPLALRGATARRAEILARYFEGAAHPPRFAAGEIGFLAWRTRLYIIDAQGLIDRELAHLPLTARGRPGHEHEATAAYLLARGADLASGPLYDPPYQQLATLTLDGHRFGLAHYREDLLAGLRGKPGVELTEMPHYLDDYIAGASRVPADRFAADLAFFDAYYFSVHPDPARRAALLAAR